MLRYVDICFTCLNCMNIGSHAVLPLSSQGQPLIFVLPAFRLLYRIRGAGKQL
jgi:hypothetical protein